MSLSLKKISMLLLAGILLFSLIGCNGPAPGYDPVITMKANDSTAPGNIEAGSTVALTAAATDLTSDNRVVEATWSAIDPVTGQPVGRFLFGTTIQLTNAWITPQAVSEPIFVDVSLMVKTLMGGKTTSVLHLLLVPKGNIPQYIFDYAAMDMLTSSNKIAGQRFQIQGQVEVNGVPIVLADHEVKFEWSDLSGNPGFESTNIQEPQWTPPALQNDSNGIPIPETHYLMVKTTVDGYSSTNTLVVNVVPAIP